MRTLGFFAMVLVTLLAIAGSPAAQQTTGAGEAAAAAAQQAPAASDAPAAGQPTVAPGPMTTGLPQAAPPPRTLRAYWHVFIAFALAWGLLFGYALVLGRRFAGLESQIRRLEGGGR